ncbi:MAG TPA: hypothetical protein VGQ23_08225 [Burkholderiaceae bacterium]|jgi:hypothetical protein|nr:hypothetical protein [Burkholderiaceae bacterium]
MSNFGLQTLTWGTVAAAIASALWLASGDSGLGDLRPAREQAERATASSADGGAVTRHRARANGQRTPREPHKPAREP